MADLSASESAVRQAVVEGTNQKQALAWDWFKQYLSSIGIESDWFLDGFTRYQKHRILGAFAAALGEGRFSNKRVSVPKSDSIWAALDCVAQTFKLANRPDPRLDADSNVAFILQRQLRAYRGFDNHEKQQVAVTGSVLRKFIDISISSADKAMSELFTSAFFFAMRSCEYLKVSGPRKTKIICLRNIHFFKGARQLPHSSKNLHLADTVSITFEEQKRDTKNDIITHHRTHDNTLCPVKIWTKIVCCLISYPTTTSDTPINTFLMTTGKYINFSGTQLLKWLWLAAAAIGKNTLGFSPEQIGLHSARSGAAMAMYLAGVPVFTIMLMGRWSSDAFLRYIRKQVKEFSSGISKKMITNEKFFTMPLASHEDPRVQNHPLNLASRKINGRGFKDAIMPLVSVFHWLAF
jgi:hypothetical protein